MAEAGDIRAGGAYVELGTKEDKLKAGLDKADAALKEWSSKAASLIGNAREAAKQFADGMASLGGKLMALGAAMSAPLAIAAKQAADYGEKIGRLASQTGMSAEALSGLKYQAESMGVSLDAVASGVKGMQKAMFDGSKDTVAAFKSVGLSVSELKTMSPESQLANIADALATVENPGQRAALAMQLLGKSGVGLLPVLEGGSREMNRMLQEASKLGLVLSGEAADDLNQLDAAFDRMEGSIKGASLAIGNALAPWLEVIVNEVVDCIIAFTQWINANEQVVVEWAKLAVEITAAGAALFAVGTVIAALMSPAVLVTAAIIGIGTAVLAVTDTLGVTATGFGELFNSIRIGGTGLGTWMASFWILLQQGWNTLTANLQYSWKACWYAIQTTMRTVLDWMLEAIATALEGIAGFAMAANSILPKRMQIGTDGLTGSAQSMRGIQGGLHQNDAEDRRSLEGVLYERDRRNSALERQKQNLFTADPQDSTTGISIDTDRAKKALGTIGDNIWNALSEAASGIKGAFNVQTQSWEPPAAQKINFAAPTGGSKDAFSATGTFSGFVGGELAASGVFNKQLQEQREANEHLKRISENTSGGAVAAGFAG
jgi:TP901 family phage tail tape measure protein